MTDLAVSPEGHIYFDKEALQTSEEGGPLFSGDPLVGLLHLGMKEWSFTLSPSFLFWQAFVQKLIANICKLQKEQDLLQIPPPKLEELQEVLTHAPFMKGSEYLNVEVLVVLWKRLLEAFQAQVAQFSGSIQKYLEHHNPRWNLVGRVCFHLAENKNDEERPFAFLATYTTKLSSSQAAQHVPLKKALLEYAGEKNHATLLSLLLPVQKAANQSSFIKSLVDSGSLFQPQSWTAQEAHSFLKEIPLLEQSGVVIRVPNWWNPQKPPRPKVSITVGSQSQSMLGLDTLLDFRMHLALENGQVLSREEWASLMAAKSNLIKIKGNWVEVDKEKLQSVLSQWDSIQASAENGLSMTEALRLLADTPTKNTKTETKEWASVEAGEWLKGVLDQLRNPHSSQNELLEAVLKEKLQGTLRPYQLAGVKWLSLLYQLKLGGCLADDMGLGKTVQVLALLLCIKYLPSSCPASKPHLLIVPASLLGNWQAELLRFAPSLNVCLAHSSSNRSSFLAQDDLIITTYGFLHRSEWIQKMDFDMVIVDEAQGIKNPDTKQTRAIKALKGQRRLLLTGTPIENRLSDLWSLFDFALPGLLGSAKEFTAHSKKAGSERQGEDYLRFTTALRKLTQPYILRRLKTDKKIIKDLPVKTEMHAFCSLSKEQALLYQESIDELAFKLNGLEGIKRRGLVLSYLLRLKQICNHPSQWLGHGEYAEEKSGKFLRLKEIVEEIALKQEKVLIFTQFREIIPALFTYLAQLFGREGLTLHGETAIKKRQHLVNQFQEEQGPPFFLLSLKAGGTGLNLTRASHVIHFDRWWNPAVENQATDRAYRIGQTRPVLVHKFVCRGTIEEKIDDLLTSKQNLSHDVLGGEEVSLTEFSNKELLELVSLDINRALGE